MSLSSEHRALLFLGGVLVLGAGTRLYRAHTASDPTAAAVSALDAQRDAVEKARARKGAKRARAQNDSVGERKSKKKRGRKARTDSVAKSSRNVTRIVDLDTAPEAEIADLPHISQAMASRIVADRDSLGAFGSLEGLQRVSGIGPKTAEKLSDLVTFSGTPRPSSSVLNVRANSPKKRRKM